MKKEIQADFEIGYSFHECESLLLEQDNLEFQCAASDVFQRMFCLKKNPRSSTFKSGIFGVDIVVENPIHLLNILL
ncbi:hypothetical protein TNIN_483691 [Trichonephila inaurata madagascariensis]|uniref:Uncharacterized protein n=1 Tax=Trichonephila inaurata madagascariensis TaxID=2747483 RepID=A0A8X6XUV2_9ARAC|nr:hypothetical protein TNIN_483691 [Trichonephila inaurata madagascariensis]